MALPATGTVPTTSRDASVELDASTIEPVNPADVDSGADIANRATNLASGQTTPAELDGAVRGNETTFAVLETYYQDPQQAAERLKTLDPAERESLAQGELGVLGELRDEPKTVAVGSGTVPTDLTPETLGPGLAAYSQDRNDYSAAYEVADQREQDRSTGVEPRPEMTPDQDPVIEGEGGQAPSTSGQAGETKTQAPGVEKMMNDQVMQLAMRYDL